MSSITMQAAIESAEKLSPNDQMTLVAHLLNQSRRRSIASEAVTPVNGVYLGLLLETVDSIMAQYDEPLSEYALHLIDTVLGNIQGIVMDCRTHTISVKSMAALLHTVGDFEQATIQGKSIPNFIPEMLQAMERHGERSDSLILEIYHVCNQVRLKVESLQRANHNSNENEGHSR